MLGFGLNSVQKIVATALKSILRKVDRIIRATNSCIDDILVDKTVVCAMEVVRHLKEFRLIAKLLEPIVGRAALGLKLQRDGTCMLAFHRGKDILELGTKVSRRELFSMCGKLVGHYPIMGWLHTACS